MPKILIIEDDPAIVAAVRKTFTLEKSYELVHLPRPERAVETVRELRPDLVLLDVMMPGADGRLVLKALKADRATAAVPVIFLTGCASTGDKVLGLNLGADDYVTKPFGALELLARISAVLRRSQGLPGAAPPAPVPAPARAKGKTLESSGLRLDPESGDAAYKGRALHLQPREFEVLRLLVESAGRVLSRVYLMENSSSYGLPASPRSLDSHIKNIRRKLGAGAKLIETVPKRGYRFLSVDA
ncbi:MAG: response regulator transcription factor [Elusimicrobiota bacterium]|jgi:DNA-binding response OmpR family regulator